MTTVVFTEKLDMGSCWKVKRNQSGTYEVVASVVGVGTVPNDQDRFTIIMS